MASKVDIISMENNKSNLWIKFPGKANWKELLGI